MRFLAVWTVCLWTVWYSLAWRSPSFCAPVTYALTLCLVRLPCMPARRNVSRSPRRSRRGWSKRRRPSVTFRTSRRRPLMSDWCVAPHTRICAVPSFCAITFFHSPDLCPTCFLFVARCTLTWWCFAGRGRRKANGREREADGEDQADEQPRV